MQPRPDTVLRVLTADIVDRTGRAVTIAIDGGRTAVLPIANIDVSPAEDGRYVIELPTQLAAETGVL